jgi:hypothetical protein
VRKKSIRVGRGTYLKDLKFISMREGLLAIIKTLSSVPFPNFQESEGGIVSPDYQMKGCGLIFEFTIRSLYNSI